MHLFPFSIYILSLVKKLRRQTQIANQIKHLSAFLIIFEGGGGGKLQKMKQK